MTLNKLNEVVEKDREMVKQGKLQDGAFGIKECRKSIEWKLKMAQGKKTLQDIYGELVVRGLNEWGFNTLMIVACEQMIEEMEGTK